MNIENNKLHTALKTILSNKYFDEYKFLNVNSIKREFRKKAMLFHPDRAKINGKNEELISEQFKRLNNAYSYISPFLKSKKYISIPYNKPYYKHQYTKHKYNKTFYNSYKTRVLPKLKLRLCRYLYYKGIINYKTIINALVWQLQNRPKVGEIAVMNKFIKLDKILKIIRNRKIGEKFCEAAVRLNYLNTHHVSHIIKIQNSYNAPIGKYFLENKLLTRNQLHSILLELKKHNLKY